MILAGVDLNSVSPGSAGIFLGTGGIVANLAGGQITAAVYGIYSGGAVIVTNSASVIGTINGIQLQAASNVTNSASISGVLGTGIVFGAGGGVGGGTNQTGATISGGVYGIFTTGAGVTVNTAGVVTGPTGSGISINGAGSFSNGGGVISGKTAGISDTGAVATVSNSGLILGTAGNGIQLNSGGAVTNSGTITGGPAGTGVILAGGGGTVNNSGSIIGSGGTAVSLSSGFTNRVDVFPGAVFTGKVNGGNTPGGATVSTLKLAFASPTNGTLSFCSPGTVSGTITGFGIGDQIVLSGINDGASVSLSSGNLLTVSESGGQTVQLQFDPAQSFTGESFHEAVSGGATNITLTSAVKPVVSVDNGLTVTVGGTGTITSGVLLAVETGDTPAQLTYTVTTAPTHGTVVKGGSTVSSFTQADINSGAIAYQENGSAATSDTFAFSVADPNNGTVTGPFAVAITTTATTMPVIAVDTGVTVPVSGTGTITSSVLLASETGDTPAQLTYTVTSAPADGAVLKNGASVTSFTQADINNGAITYQENGSSATSGSFGFKVTDQNNNSATGTFPVRISGLGIPAGLVNMYHEEILRVPAPASAVTTDNAALAAGTLSTAQLRAQLEATAQASTIPALLAFDFMDGVAPSSSGLTYLTTFATDLGAGNYTFTGGVQLGTFPNQYNLPQFSQLNTYVNFCATDVQIANNPFTAAYGSLALTPSTADRTTFFNEVYQQIFGFAPDPTTTSYFVNGLRSDPFNPTGPQITNFQFYVEYSGSELGAYGSVAGVLLSTAETSSPQIGLYPGEVASFLSLAATSGAAGDDTAPYGQSLLTANLPSGTSHALSEASMPAADPSVIMIAGAGQLTDPGVGKFSIQFMQGTGALVLHANSVDHVSGFDPTMDVLDLRAAGRGERQPERGYRGPEQIPHGRGPRF
jgi:hypothetical protein